MCSRNLWPWLCSSVPYAEARHCSPPWWLNCCRSKCCASAAVNDVLQTYSGCMMQYHWSRKVTDEKTHNRDAQTQECTQACCCNQNTQRTGRKNAEDTNIESWDPPINICHRILESYQSSPSNLCNHPYLITPDLYISLWYLSQHRGPHPWVHWYLY